MSHDSNFYCKKENYPKIECSWDKYWPLGDEETITSCPTGEKVHIPALASSARYRLMYPKPLTSLWYALAHALFYMHVLHPSNDMSWYEQEQRIHKMFWILQNGGLWGAHLGDFEEGQSVEADDALRGMLFLLQDETENQC